MSDGAKQRLDIALVDRGLARSRSQARDLIKRGLVSIDGAVVAKPGLPVTSFSDITIDCVDAHYVSRGGTKLAFALDHFDVPVAGSVALDIGASTGGFTQVLLEQGAKRVYAVDVGEGQLHRDIRQHSNVISLDGTDARHLDQTLVPEQVDVITADVSFVSLTKVLGTALTFAAPRAFLVALIKPQFELGPQKIGKGGVVREDADRALAVDKVIAWLTTTMGWEVMGCVLSPIKGAGGNQEFLVVASLSQDK